MTFRKILVPYDGSKPSEAALKHAVSLLKLVKSGKLVLLNIVQEIPIPPMMFESRMRSTKTGEETSVAAVWKELHQDLKSAAQKMLSEKKPDLEAAGVEVKMRVEVGYPSDRILAIADEEDVDLIVIGNVGLSGFSKLRAIGSVSRTVSEKAKCPVLIVH
ncbi:MAG: universal stress protein [Nitrososphaera sp.]|uniref:universal stress protein n=1 Tax=Nitrososphaera sp. TaxID=1971748 RepID=UPI00184D9956|nr:universal stress protein [Nitrososphaera sp.]NWG36408.1 universal stress protein [Nitrososphaera sp.]